MKAIFPNFDLVVTEEKDYRLYQIYSFIRKFEHGVWWKFMVAKSLGANKNVAIEHATESTIKLFIEECYKALLYAQMPPIERCAELKDRFGEPLFQVDSDQTSEKERMSATTKIN